MTAKDKLGLFGRSMLCNSCMASLGWILANNRRTETRENLAQQRNKRSEPSLSTVSDATIAALHPKSRR